jgi:hypothetical protein
MECDGARRAIHIPATETLFSVCAQFGVGALLGLSAQALRSRRMPLKSSDEVGEGRFQGPSQLRSAAMQSVSPFTPVLTNYADSLQKLYKKSVLRLWYVKLEILNGFNVFTPRIGDHSAILTYSRHGRKIFKYHIGLYDLDEFFTMLEFCEAGDQDQQFILGKFEFRITTLEDVVSIGIDFLSHHVEVAGKRAQLKAAIFEYRALRQRLVRTPKAKAYARSSTLEHH